MGTPFLSFSIPSLDGDGVTGAVAFPSLHAFHTSVSYLLEKVSSSRSCLSSRSPLRFWFLLQSSRSPQGEKQDLVPGSRTASRPAPNGEPISGGCFAVVSTGVCRLTASSRSWSPSTRGAGSLPMGAGPPTSLCLARAGAPCPRRAWRPWGA